MNQQELTKERLGILVELVSQISQERYRCNWRTGIEDVILEDWDNPDYAKVTGLAARWNLWLSRDSQTGEVKPENLLVLNVGGERRAEP